MIVVSDTSPLNYLILIGADHVLPILFGEVIAPTSVLLEMSRAKAPTQVKAWAANPPSWLCVRSATRPLAVGRLGLGETESLSLAHECRAAAVLMDDRDGVALAKQLGLAVIGTLAILESAAEKGMIDLPAMILSLRQTTFRASEELLNQILDRDVRRRNTKP